MVVHGSGRVCNRLRRRHSTARLTKLSSAVPKQEKQEEKPPDNPFAVAPANTEQNTNQSSEDPFATPQTTTSQAGNGSSGYGASQPQPQPQPDNTYGLAPPLC